MKKSRMRETVIFQNNCPIDVLKKPVQPRRRTPPTTQVFVGIIPEHLTFPIDVFGCGPRGQASLEVGWFAGPWAIGDDHELRRACVTNLSQHACRSLRTIKNE